MKPPSTNATPERKEEVKRLLVCLGVVAALSAFSMQSYSINSLVIPFNTDVTPATSPLGTTTFVAYTPPAAAAGGLGFEKAIVYWQAKTAEYVVIRFYTHTTDLYAGTTTAIGDTFTVWGDALGTGQIFTYDRGVSIDSIYVRLENEADASISIIPDFSK